MEITRTANIINEAEETKQVPKNPTPETEEKIVDLDFLRKFTKVIGRVYRRKQNLY